MFLLGYGGDVCFGKVGKGYFMFEIGLIWCLFGFELNDLGFMCNVDEI